MRMRFQRWSRLASALVLIAAASLAVPAQEPPEPEPTPPETPAPPPEAPPPTPPPAPTASESAEPAAEPAIDDDRLGHWHLDLEEWIAQPSGLEYVSVLVADPSNPGASLQLGTQHGTSTELRVDVGFTFRGDAGGITLKHWSHEDQANFSEYDPGTFALGEQLLPLRFAGVFDDGASDAFDSYANTTTRDLRLDYTRQAFSTRRATGRWSVGLREVDHNREFSGRYHAILSGMPLVVGREDLDPQADLATVLSRFSGRGPDFGFDVQIPLGKRFRFAAEVSTAILRGDLETAYSSISHLYAVMPGDTIEQVLGEDLVPFLNEWLLLPDTGPDARPQILQLAVPAGVYNASRSTSATVLEGALSFRYRAWRGLDVFGGFRSTRYTDVASDIRPTLSTSSVLGQVPETAPGVSGLTATLPVVGVVETRRSVDYEGFFLGLGYTY